MMNVDQQLNDVVRWPCVSKRAAINKVPIIAKYAIAATVTLINDYNDNSDDDDAQMQLAATTTRTTTPTSLSSSSSRLRGEPQQQQQQQLKYDDEDDASNHNQNHPAVNAASSCIDITTNNTSATAITNNNNNKTHNSYTNRNHYSSNSSQLLQHSLQLISSTMFNLALSFRIIFLLAVINSSLVVAVSGVAAVDASHPHNVLDDDAVVYGHFTPTWAVHIPEGRATAERVAHDHGFTILGDIFDDHYHFHHSAVSKRSTDASDHHQLRLDDDDRVHWSKQQRIKSRSKRDFLRMRTARITPWASSLSFNDEKWEQMWYLRRGKNLDMNVLPAWKEGITGRGVVVTILDDGLEVDHPDLLQNYDPKASHDVNSNDEDPMPHYDLTDSNRHGTRCAGEVAATANNSICAVGIAYNARVGGVRMLDGEVTDAVEARSLSFSPQHIDIYSASWGPDDDGKTVDGPGEMATKAFIEGVTKGRNGKGSIFVWASGNGGREHDNCNCDGYTNSIWTLSISSATERGNVPWYSEKCSSTLATTYSSGGTFEKQVITTDLHHSCTGSHTGTSASAPLAAGIVALVLEANRNLTWRDLQHIVVRTAKPMNLNDTTWIRNGVGRLVSHSFGYGLMDAYNMVKLARTWKTVPAQQRCEINAPHLDKSISSKSYLTLQLDVEHCRNVNYLEHVQAKITLTSQRRGDIQIYLKSPAGTRVNLLTSRSHDVSRSGFNQWPFMSVHTWGESPHGNWQLEIHNEGMFMAQITHWDLICYGTETPSQPGDQPFYNEGKTAGLDNLNNLEHNSLEMEADNGKWHVLHQQVGENHVDVQRTTLNDQTGTACLKFAPNQTCIGLCLLFLLARLLSQNSYNNYHSHSCTPKIYRKSNSATNTLKHTKNSLIDSRLVVENSAVTTLLRLRSCAMGMGGDGTSLVCPSTQTLLT